MAQYTLIAPDGTRTLVKYNPHHDGPVSERITKLSRLRWLLKWCKNHPADFAKQRELATLQRSLYPNRRAFQRPQKRKHHQKRLSWNAPSAPNRTSKAHPPLDTGTTLQPQQRLTAEHSNSQSGNANPAPTALNAPSTIPESANPSRLALNSNSPGAMSR